MQSSLSRSLPQGRRGRTKRNERNLCPVSCSAFLWCPYPRRRQHALNPVRYYFSFWHAARRHTACRQRHIPVSAKPKSGDVSKEIQGQNHSRGASTDPPLQRKQRRPPETKAKKTTQGFGARPQENKTAKTPVEAPKAKSSKNLTHMAPSAVDLYGGSHRFHMDQNQQQDDSVVTKWLTAKRSAFSVEETKKTLKDGFPANYFRNRFAVAGLINFDTGVLQPDATQGKLSRISCGDPIYVGINAMLTNCSRWQTVAQLLAELGYLFNEHNICTAAHRLARLANKHNVSHVRPHPGYGFLHHSLLQRLPTLEARYVANIFWAFLTLREPDKVLYRGIVDRICELTVAKFSKQELSMVARSLAVLYNNSGVKEAALLEDIVVESVHRNFVELQPQAIANIVWSCTVMGVTPPAMFTDLAVAVGKQPSNFEPQAIAQILWCCSEYPFPERIAFFFTVATDISMRLHEFSSQDLLNTLLAMNRVRCKHKGFLAAFDRELGKAGRLDDIQPKAIADIMCALANMRWLPSPITMDALLSFFSVHLHEFAAQELVRVLHAIAKLNCDCRLLTDKLLDRIHTIVTQQSFTSQAAANALWAMSVLEVNYHPLFPVMVEYLVNEGIAKSDQLLLSQLHLAVLALTGKHAEAARKLLPDHLQEWGADVWQEQSSKVVISKFHMDVSEMLLHEVGFPHEVELKTPDGFFSIDCAHRSDKHMIALEVDGPLHFTRNTRQELGHTVLRRRLLEARGWTVVSVAGFEWHNKSKEEQLLLLKTKLKNAGVDTPIAAQALAGNKAGSPSPSPLAAAALPRNKTVSSKADSRRTPSPSVTGHQGNRNTRSLLQGVRPDTRNPIKTLPGSFPSASGGAAGNTLAASDGVDPRKQQLRIHNRQELDIMIKKWMKPRQSAFDIEPTIEMSREGFPEGYFRKRFAAVGVMDLETGVPQIDVIQGTIIGLGFKDPLYLGINSMLSTATRWHTVARVLVEVGHLFDKINISTAAHRLAKLSKRREVGLIRRNDAYSVLQHLLASSLSTMGARQIANVLWAYVNLQETDKSIYKGLVERIEEVPLHKYREQELSIISWSIAVLYQINGMRHATLLENIVTESLRRDFKWFKPQALSNIVWACATMEVNCEAMYNALSATVVERLSEFSPQSISNILWGCSEVPFTERAVMFRKIAGNIMTRLNDFGGQEVSNTLLAYSRVGFIHEKLLAALDKEFCLPGRLDRFPPQAVANSLHSLANLRYLPSPVAMEALLTSVSIHVRSFKYQELVSVLYSLSKLTYDAGPLVDTLLERIHHNVIMQADFGNQAATNTLWAMTVFKRTDNPLFMILIKRLVENGIPKDGASQLSQLYQALMALKGAEGKAALALLPARLQHWGTRVWRAHGRNSCISVFHQDVSDMLSVKLGIEHHVELKTQDGFFSVDCAFKSGNRRIAIEVDGPSHFTVNTNRPLGHTVLRRRQLEARGWTVVSIPVYEWDGQSDKEQAAMLRRKLMEAGIPLPTPQQVKALNEARAAAATIGHGEGDSKLQEEYWDDEDMSPDIHSRAEQQQRQDSGHQQQQPQEAGALRVQSATLPKQAQKQFSLQETTRQAEQERQQQHLDAERARLSAAPPIAAPRLGSSPQEWQKYRDILRQRRQAEEAPVPVLTGTSPGATGTGTGSDSDMGDRPLLRRRRAPVMRQSLAPPNQTQNSDQSLTAIPEAPQPSSSPREWESYKEALSQRRNQLQHLQQQQLQAEALVMKQSAALRHRQQLPQNQFPHSSRQHPAQQPQPQRQQPAQRQEQQPQQPAQLQQPQQPAQLQQQQRRPDAADHAAAAEARSGRSFKMVVPASRRSKRSPATTSPLAKPLQLQHQTSVANPKAGSAQPPGAKRKTHS